MNEKLLGIGGGTKSDETWVISNEVTSPSVGVWDGKVTDL